MDSIQNMVKDKLTEAVLENIGEQFGLDASKTGQVTDVALPMILGGLGKNAEDQKAAEELDKAVEQDHDGSILDHIQDSIKDRSKQEEGQKILGHVFGDKITDVVGILGKSADINSEKASGILGVLAPIVLGQLGKSKREQGLDVSGLTDLLKGEKKNADNQLGGFMALLDMDKDGSVMDDVLEIGKKLFQK